MNIQWHGMGAIQSPPDPRDFDVTDLLAATDRLAAALPGNWMAPGLPPILDQRLTPQCVAHSHSSMKAWMDRRDQGKFFNFNENLFHYQIGGTAAGAVARYALERMRAYGYPEVTYDRKHLHRITAYYSVPKSIDTIKQALQAFGPLTMIGPWYPSWINNLPASAILPRPSGTPNGHAVLLIGWDNARGCFLFQNSWGSAWGSNGRAWMPYSYAINIMWEIWKAVDQKVTTVVTPPSLNGRARIAGPNCNIRTSMSTTGTANIYATSKTDGYTYRRIQPSLGWGARLWANTSQFYFLGWDTTGQWARLRTGSGMNLFTHRSVTYVIRNP
jgi:hypothetical protein